MFKNQFDKLIRENKSSPKVIKPIDTDFSCTLKTTGVRKFVIEMLRLDEWKMKRYIWVWKHQKEEQKKVCKNCRHWWHPS